MTCCKPAGTFADLKHLKGRSGTNIALDYHLRRGDVDKAFASADRVFEHTFRTQQCLHLAVRAVRLGRRAGRRRADDLHRRTRRRPSCASRSRGCSAGRKTACASRCRISAAASARKLYIKLEALVAALALLVAPAGEDRADDGRAVLHDHQASDDVPHQERRRQGRPRHRRATARCSGTAAPMPISARA